MAGYLWLPICALPSVLDVELLLLTPNENGTVYSEKRYFPLTISHNCGQDLEIKSAIGPHWNRDHEAKLELQIMNQRMLKLAVFSLALAVAGTARATIVDLTTGDSGTINAAVFSTLAASNRRVRGVIDPVPARAEADPSEQGYNTSGGTHL